MAAPKKAGTIKLRDQHSAARARKATLAGTVRITDEHTATVHPRKAA